MDARPALDAANAALAEADDRLTTGFCAPEHPVTFIVGLPRSGTTLLHQVLAASLRIGYVSNLLARFWRAPFIGAAYERDILGVPVAARFTSRYGNTFGAAEPAEWGWFWRHWLAMPERGRCVGEDFDPRMLTRKLHALEAAKGLPLLFKNLDLTLNIGRFAGLFRRVLLIEIRRDPLRVCESLLVARLDRYGDPRTPFGPMTSSAAETDPVRAVVRQARDLAEEIQTAKTAVGASAALTIEYDELCAKPERAVERVRHFMLGHGVSLERGETPLPESFADRTEPDPAVEPFQARLERLAAEEIDGDRPRLSA